MGREIRYTTMRPDVTLPDSSLFPAVSTTAVWTSEMGLNV